MATLALPLKASMPRIAPFFPFAVALVPQAQGVEGKRIQEVTEEVLRHWYDRPGCLLLEDPDADELSYKSVPMDFAFTVRVKYRYGGELDPLPYPPGD